VSAAYWALGEMVRERCRVRDAEDADSARQKLSATVMEFIPDQQERAWVEPRLAALLGLAEVPAGDVGELFAAWRTFFERITERGTVVLIFEDIHWADESLYDFIEHLLEWARSSAILVVALARPELLERRPAWGSAHRATTMVHLEPLSDQEMRDLLVGLVPGLPAAPLDQVVARAEGVPLYAVETVRMLLDEERLVLEGERYRLVDETSEVAMPATLQALISARLDALLTAERSLVQDAAVLGKTFSRDALAQTGHSDDSGLDALLQALVRKEILAQETSRTSPERGQYGFVQGLLREVAYNTLSKRDRRERHLSAAHHYESLDEEELAGLVASHYLDAYRSAPDGPDGEEAAGQAAVALRIAAERSISLHANAAALSFIEQALSVTTNPRERAHLWVIAHEPASAQNEIELGERYLRQAIEWYRHNGPPSQAHRATAILAAALVGQSRVEEVLTLVEPALGELDIDADPSAPQLLNELARAHLWSDRADLAMGPLDRGLAIAERLRLEYEIAELFATKYWAVETQGRHLEALMLAEGSLRIAMRLGIASTEMRARLNLSNGLITTDPRRGFDIAATGVDLARRIGHEGWAGALAGNQGMAAFLIGRWDVPIEYLEEVGSNTRISGLGRSGAVSPAAIVEASRGRPHGELSTEALDALEIVKSPQATSMALGLRALLAYASGRLDEVVAPALEATAGTATPGEGVIAPCVAANAATWLRDREQMEILAARLREFRWAGDVPATGLLQLEAALAALDGEPESAERGYREALATWRRLEMLPTMATTQMEMLLLLGERLDDRAELAAEARGILTGLEAVTLLARLDEVASIEQQTETEVVT